MSSKINEMISKKMYDELRTALFKLENEKIFGAKT